MRISTHFLRFQEAYGNAFLEAVSRMLNLGTYRPASKEDMLRYFLRGYHDLVVLSLDSHSLVEPEVFEAAKEGFELLKNGGEKGGLFEPSLLTIEDLEPEYRRLVIRDRQTCSTVDEETRT